MSGISASLSLALTVSLPGDAVGGLTSTAVNKHGPFHGSDTPGITLLYSAKENQDEGDSSSRISPVRPLHS